jgi:hypothetical protein
MIVRLIFCLGIAGQQHLLQLCRMHGSPDGVCCFARHGDGGWLTVVCEIVSGAGGGTQTNTARLRTPWRTISSRCVRHDSRRRDFTDFTDARNNEIIEICAIIVIAIWTKNCCTDCALLRSAADMGPASLKALYEGPTEWS